MKVTISGTFNVTPAINSGDLHVIAREINIILHKIAAQNGLEVSDVRLGVAPGDLVGDVVREYRADYRSSELEDAVNALARVVDS